MIAAQHPDAKWRETSPGGDRGGGGDVTVSVSQQPRRSIGWRHPLDVLDDPGQGSRRGDDAKHTFLAADERRMPALTTHAGAERRVSFRVALSLQVKALLDPAQPYYALRWK